MSSAGSHNGLLIYCFCFIILVCCFWRNSGGGLPLNWYPLKTREEVVRPPWLGRCRSGIVCTIMFLFLLINLLWRLLI